MLVERYYLSCLAHASYLVHDGGEAAVIDPRRDVEIYLTEAKRLGVTIRWVIETHLHADFVSGHLELAKRCGATVCLGAGSGATFPHRELRDGEELPLGAGKLRILATPGHTEESVSIVALSAAHPDEPLAVFTGDTLFIGDVGRPDLSRTRTPRELAGMLYDSLHGKLLGLPDGTLVYPAHGAGSLCGRQLGTDSSSTIGRERLNNYALLAPSRERFIELLTADLPSRPAYFGDEVERNRAGAASLDELAPLAALTPEATAARQETGAIVLDTRPGMEFAAGHIPAAVHIALEGQFASWAARLLGVDSRVVLVADDEAALQEARLRLARVGVENVVGYVAGGVEAWVESGRQLQPVTQVAAGDLARMIDSRAPGLTVVDVREPAEREKAGCIPASVSIPLGDLPKRLEELPRQGTVVVHCKGGYRSSAAASILEAAGFPDVVNLTGGFDAWQLRPAGRAM